MGQFVFDEDDVYDRMTKQTLLNTAQGAVTFYVVACSGEDGLSHGGLVMHDAQEAVEVAKSANADVADTHPCRYIPLAIGFDAALAEQLFNETRRHVQGEEGL